MPLNTKAQRRVTTTSAMTNESTVLLAAVHNGETSANRGALTKKLLLWLVLVLQVCFITSLWLLQMGGLQALNGGESTIPATGLPGKTNTKTFPSAEQRVNFIRKAALAGVVEKRNQTSRTTPVMAQKTEKPNVSNFWKDFFVKTNRLNKTATYTEDDIALRFEVAAEEPEKEVWCFREGAEQTTTLSDNTDSNRIIESDEEHCRCLVGWHGSDCGQPEIIWRTLIAARQPAFALLSPRIGVIHRLIYLLEGNYFNLDLLEMQLRVVQEVVDYFIIFIRNVNVKRRQYKAVERRVREVLSQGSYELMLCTQGSVKTSNCTALHAYKRLREKTLEKGQMPFQVQAFDLLLYSTDKELISPHALKFLKYYAADNMPAMRFRLKYVVYGFYWQHPQQTQLSGLISSFAQLDDQPTLLNNKHEPSGNSAQNVVIGDLNHFGGWFCKYCQQPDEIVDELFATDTNSLQHVHFPNATRNRNIDANYLQKLIANGIGLEDKTQLIKLRRHTERYYAPEYAEKYSWKFSNLLTNLYESLDDDIDDEDEM